MRLPDRHLEMRTPSTIYPVWSLIYNCGLSLGTQKKVKNTPPERILLSMLQREMSFLAPVGSQLKPWSMRLDFNTRISSRKETGEDNGTERRSTKIQRCLNSKQICHLPTPVLYVGHLQGRQFHSEVKSL